MAWRKKNKKEVPIVRLSDEDLTAVEESVAELVKSQLPIGRVKKVVRMNPDVEMVNSEALQMMTKAAELFVKELSNAANYHAALEKRKTVQGKDIDKAIKKNWTFAFLEDALDGWPRMEPKKRNKANGESQEDTQENEEIEGVDESQEPDENDENDEGDIPETVPEVDEFADEFVEKEDVPVTKDTFAEQF